MEKVKKDKATKKRNWFLAFFNDASKTDLKWWNRNYFYLGTILIVAINILIFAFVNKSPWEIVGYKSNEGSWTSVFYFKPTLTLFLSNFFHSSWQHVLLNMLCFFVAGIYLERKMGTFGLAGFVLFAAYVSAVAVGANDLSVYSVGYSGVNYLVYATIILDYLFSYQKHRRNKTNIVLGSIVVVLIYLAMCFNDGAAKFPFSPEPYDLLHNMAHYTSFVAGIIVGLFVEAIRFSARKMALKQNETKEESVKGIVIIDTTEIDAGEKKKKKTKSSKKKAKKEPATEEEKVETSNPEEVKVEEPKAEETAAPLTEEKKVEAPAKKLSAVPEEMKKVTVKRTYKKKKKSTATTKPVLVIKPVVAKAPKTTKKDDKK